MIAEIPAEEHRTAREPYARLVERLSHQSVKKHFDAYTDIAWDAPEMRIDADDPRWELPADSPLGATAWYRAQPAGVRTRIGLRTVAHFMKVGVQFENVLSRGLLNFAASQPNASPEFRYAYHEVIEESQHSLMFQEFINRSGVDAPALTGVRRHLSGTVVGLGRRFPELFFLFVLGGEDPIDHLQRVQMSSERDLHPLVRRISQIHLTEEARHLCFARQYLRERVPRLPPWKRQALSLLAPAVLHLMVRTMLEPSSGIVDAFAIPQSVVDEAWRKNPRHRAGAVESLAKVRALCEELGLVTARSLPAWRRLGIA